MVVVRVSAIAAAALIAAVGFAGCRRAALDHGTTMAAKGTTMRSTDPALLHKFITLPAEPLSVTWQTEDGNPGNWALTALLHFSREQLDGLLARGKRLDGPPVPLPRAEVLSWFPPAVRARYEKTPAGPDGTVPVDAVAIDPSGFFRSPLNNGEALVFLPESLVFLRFYTM
jgi:hypothetical protein